MIWHCQLLSDCQTVKRFHVEHASETAEDGIRLESWQPDMERFGWLGAFDEAGDLKGICQMRPDNSVLLSAHIVVARDARHSSLELGRLFLSWIFKETNYSTVTTTVPDCFRHVRLYVRKLGFETLGRLPDSVRHHGRLWDQTLFGLTRKQWSGL